MALPIGKIVKTALKKKVAMEGGKLSLKKTLLKRAGTTDPIRTRMPAQQRTRTRRTY